MDWLKQNLYAVLQLDCYQELGLIILMFVVMVLMFSSLIFAFEREGPEASYWSFYDCIWWGLMTLTTVGYHLQVKHTRSHLTIFSPVWSAKYLCWEVYLWSVCSLWSLHIDPPHTYRGQQVTQWPLTSSVRQNFSLASPSVTNGNCGGTRSLPGGGWPGDMMTYSISIIW